MKLRTSLATLALALGAASAGAATVDLVNGDSGTSNGVRYDFIVPGSGSGVLQPFLRVQETGKANELEEGYNGNFPGGDGPFDTKADGFTKPLQFKNLVYVVLNSVGFYEFLLDINENKGGTDELISLNKVMIWYSSSPQTLNPSSPTIDEFTDLTSTVFLGTKIFDMDVGVDGDTTVELSAERSSGSGYADMAMYIPASVFAGVKDNDYITFYSAWGNPNAADSTFEEWSLRKCPTCRPPAPPEVPVPGTLGLLGVGLLGLGIARRNAKA